MFRLYNSMIQLFVAIFLNLLFLSQDVLDKKVILSSINNIRTEGCKCGNKYYEAVPPLVWDSTLYISALDHAKQMHHHNFFSHFSVDGKDIGQRLTAFNYPWEVVGENIAEGQTNFSQAIEDWLKSDIHCKMIMEPRVTEMAVARYGKYWVHHFGKKLPPNAVLKN